MALETAEARRARPLVLVVDDYPATLRLVDRCLAPAGYDVVTTTSPRDSLDLLNRRHFDVAIIDIRMPEMSGLELLREIKKAHPRVEVIVTTAYPEVETAIEALKEGAYDYLRKPFNLEELGHCAARAVERRHLRREVGLLRTQLGITALKVMDPRLPIVMTAGVEELAGEAEARRAGIVYYAIKPVDLPLLDAVVARCVEKEVAR